VTLLAFAAESRAAAPLLLGADRAAIDRCLLPAGPEQQTRRPLQRRAAAKLWDGRTDGQTDRRSDGRTPDSFIDPAPHTLWVQCQRTNNKLYTVIHNYGNPYEKRNIFVARPHLWLQLGMVKPEIMLCETVLNLSTLNTLTYLRTY